MCIAYTFLEQKGFIIAIQFQFTLPLVVIDFCSECVDVFTVKFTRFGALELWLSDGPGHKKSKSGPCLPGTGPLGDRRDMGSDMGAGRSSFIDITSISCESSSLKRMKISRQKDGLGKKN